MSSEPRDRAFVRRERDTGILEAWGTVSPEINQIATRWRRKLAGFHEIVDALGVDVGPNDALRSQAGMLLSMCSNADLMEEWRERREKLRPEGEVPDWYGLIADVNEPACIVASVLLAGEAKRLRWAGVTMAGDPSPVDASFSATALRFGTLIMIVATSIVLTWVLFRGDQATILKARASAESAATCSILDGIWNADNDPPCR